MFYRAQISFLLSLYFLSSLSLLSLFSLSSLSLLSLFLLSLSLSSLSLPSLSLSLSLLSFLSLSLLSFLSLSLLSFLFLLGFVFTLCVYVCERERERDEKKTKKRGPSLEREMDAILLFFAGKGQRTNVLDERIYLIRFFYI